MSTRSCTCRRQVWRALVSTAVLVARPLGAQTPDPRVAQADAALAACASAATSDRAAEAKRTGQTASALYLAIARERPQDPAPLVGRARVLSECELPFASVFRKSGLYEKAVKLLEQALALDSTHWTARYALALNHYHLPEFLGRTADAIRQFEILLAQQGNAADFPEQAAPYAYLGDLYGRKHRAADAERVWRRGAALFPADERLRRRLENLTRPDSLRRTAQSPYLHSRAANRSDYLVRADFFAGLRGEWPAFDRAMKLCEDTLAKNPRHAEVLVWHGSGLLYLAGQAFEAGDVPGGQDLWERGLSEMDRYALQADAWFKRKNPSGTPTCQGCHIAP